MKKTLVLIIFVCLVISLSYFVISDQATGEFTVGNEAPSLSNFEVQDGASSWDSTDFNTHDATPTFRWDVDDANPDLLTASICLGTSVGVCDLADESAGTYNPGDTATYTSSLLTIEQTDCTAELCSKTFYLTINVTDGSLMVSQDFTFDLINTVPTMPSDLLVDASAVLETHNPLPTLTWTATDSDDGTTDKWPEDTLTYHIQVGAATQGDEDYLADPSTSSASADVSSSIPWGTPGTTQAITTTYVRVWSTDDLGINSDYYDTTLDLIDNLPQFTNVFLSDAPISPTASCIDFLPQPCFISPLSGDYTSVNIKLTIDDADEDCSDLTHTNKLVLCLVNASQPDLCDLTNNADYIYDLTFEGSIDSSCDFSIAIPESDSRGIEFFNSPDIYKMYISSESQAGKSTTPWNQAWELSSLFAIDYTDSVFLGDRVADGGDGIQLGVWNPGLSSAIMTNFGNKDLNLEWEATDPSTDASTCSSHTATCWDLTTANTFQIDDDNIQGESTETNLNAENVPESPTRIQFNPTSGLQICDVITCSSGIGETINTYFHIQPPVGLSPGNYQTDLTITISEAI